MMAMVAVVKRVTTIYQYYCGLDEYANNNGGGEDGKGGGCEQEQGNDDHAAADDDGYGRDPEQ